MSKKHRSFTHTIAQTLWLSVITKTTTHDAQFLAELTIWATNHKGKQLNGVRNSFDAVGVLCEGLHGISFPSAKAIAQAIFSNTRNHFFFVLVQQFHGICFLHNDTGPGERVPGEPPSHERDSANVSGHAIPAVLCGNQYAVLYDMEPTEIEVLD